MLTLVEDDRYYFDAEAAERPIRFIERYCVHYQGRKVGEPFLLETIQRQIIRDLYGWKHRSGEREGRRRFTDCYWEGAIGCGKSPMLAALGLYSLMADGEVGAQVYSLASTFSQARVVFETAKRFIAASKPLSDRLVVVDREIRHPKSRSIWQIVSGKGPGAGRKPTCILADEVWQWEGAGGYADLNDRKAKSDQPLLIAATNTPSSQASFCWSLREKAMAALAGTGDPALYPIIWAADDDAKTDDPAAWRAANPMIGVTISESAIRATCIEKMKDEQEERDFRQLYLGIVPVKAAGRWLDLELYDRATSIAFDPSSFPRETPLYIGVDLSQGNDFCAIVFVWVTRDRFYVEPRLITTRANAEHWERKDGFRYSDWAAAGDIRLLDAQTITLAAQTDIANEIIAASKRWTVKAVAYDAAYATQTIKILDAAKVPCAPVRQGWGISTGCAEFDRRLKEEPIAIAIKPNAAMRFCAENAVVKPDARGNLILQKPNADGAYKGTRGLKVDAMSALATALTEARRFAFPSTVSQFRGAMLVGGGR